MYSGARVGTRDKQMYTETDDGKPRRKRGQKRTQACTRKTSFRDRYVRRHPHIRVYMQVPPDTCLQTHFPMYCTYTHAESSGVEIPWIADEEEEKEECGEKLTRPDSMTERTCLPELLEETRDFFIRVLVRDLHAIVTGPSVHTPHPTRFSIHTPRARLKHATKERDLPLGAPSQRFSTRKRLSFCTQSRARPRSEAAKSVCCDRQAEMSTEEKKSRPSGRRTRPGREKTNPPCLSVYTKQQSYFPYHYHCSIWFLPSARRARLLIALESPPLRREEWVPTCPRQSL